METIIVEICIGVNAVASDFMLPAHVPVSKLIRELVSLVEQVYQEVTFSGETPMLCSLTSGTIIPMDMTLAQAGVRDSHQLMLV
ncbi:MAG: EsaB/YukD family protein [Clostridia bacterium]|nr:EsaB/YukD family protein [Clostridia bacterium]